MSVINIINEIKSCPKCGSTDIYHRYVREYDKPSMNDHWLFGCFGMKKDGYMCGLTYTAQGSEEQAIRDWNQRIDNESN